jgi:hypothetical protein
MKATLPEAKIAKTAIQQIDVGESKSVRSPSHGLFSAISM